MRIPEVIGRRLTLASALLAAAAIPAAAQLHPYHSVAYTEGNLLGFGPGEGDKFGYAVASGDFNGDGADDLVTGVPGDDNLSTQAYDSGIAIVRYGAVGAGLKGGIANTVLTQIWGGSPDPAEVGDRMGTTFAVGDFDGDSFDDLAVGIVYDNDDGEPIGGVQVYYGASAGIQLSGVQFFNHHSPGIPGGSNAYDHLFGQGLAAGDFDGDGFADLAMGQPHYDSDLDISAGRIAVVYGSVHGLDSDTTQTWSEDHVGMDGSCEDYDYFGWALAAGDFDGDSRDDLAIGVPGENEGGGVQFMYGGTAGLSALNNNLWTQADDGVAGGDEYNDAFGSTLAVGDFDHDGFDDVAVSAPGEDGHAGAVHVFFGSADGPSGPTSWMWTSSLTGLGTTETGDRWGGALAVGDFDHDGFDDLAIGAYGESIGTFNRAGEITILRGYAGGMTSYRGQVFNQGTVGVPDVTESEDVFGWALAAGDFDGNGHDDLVAGSPQESTAFYQDGAATSFYGFVFADDFESAGTARWQLTNRSLLRNTNGIGASTAAKLGTSGQYGLHVSLLDAASNLVYVMAGPNQGFNNNTTLRGSFFIDVQNLTMSPAPGVNFFRLMSFEDGTGTGAKPRLTFELNRNDSVGGWAILANSWNDAANALQFAGGGGFALAGDPNGHNVRIDFEWRAGNPGHLSMWKTRYVGGAPDAAGTVPMLSVDLPGAGTAVINALYMGMISGKDPGTFGQLYLDELSISR